MPAAKFRELRNEASKEVLKAGLLKDRPFLVFNARA